MNQVFTSWSGGRDSCFACYRAIKDSRWSWIHRPSPGLLEMQSQVIGIPLVARRSTMATYETDFRDVILDLGKKGIEGEVSFVVDFRLGHASIKEVGNRGYR